METKNLNFPGRELPPYLGYGILDEQSVRFENDAITADYVLECDGTVVHKVIWQKDRCDMQTFFHGESCAISRYHDLNRALSCDFLVRNLAEDKVFGFLAETTSGLDNIYVQRPNTKGTGKQSTIYFPAGLLMSFRLPVPERTVTYGSFLGIIKESCQITFFRELKTHLLLADPALKVTLHPLVVAEFIVPLAYMTSAAKTFADSGIISPEKHFRLMVAESLQAETTFMQTFFGNGSHPYYAICFKECPQNRHPELIGAFSEAVKHLHQQK